MKKDVTSLISLIEGVISKNRSLLSVEDLRTLKRCASYLKRIRDKMNEKTVIDYLPVTIQIFSSLLKFFTDDK